ncbi:MAG: glutathione S-transferase family protein [Henriciella sp.]|nr:glutathione S-transferase family protein [Henriciella sp.]
MQLKVHGTILSPWVRRLVLFIEEKELPYELETVVPLGEPDPDFLKISPLGKIPVLEFNGRFLPDSLAACTLIESEVSDPALFPEQGWDHAWMLWLCDYLATAFFSKVEAPLFIQKFVNPNFQNTEPDQAIIDAALAYMPQVFDYLESLLLSGQAFLLGDKVSLADLTAGSIFVNFYHAGEQVDAARWPNLSDYVTRLHARPSFQRVLERERKTVGALSPIFAGSPDPVG